MIRITYQDREYTLQPDDNRDRPIRFGSAENGSWVTVLDTSSFKIEVLSGGTKSEARVESTSASVVEASQGGK